MPEPVAAFAARLAALGWVSELWVAGSAASGDHHPGVSDLDLVALVDGRIDTARHVALTQLHRDLEAGPATGANLGCAYVDAATLLDLPAKHPTWTRERWVRRSLSEIARAELVQFGVAAPNWLIEQLRARRSGADRRLPRLRTALIAWRDARRTVALARRGTDLTA